MTRAEELIQKLELARHPEGGWFRETYRAGEVIESMALPERFVGNRVFSTAIYFLLETGDISALHRIKSDEVWHYYEGAGVVIHQISPEGRYSAIRLGRDIAGGEVFQAVVPAGSWFGAEVSGNGHALVGCTVAPGFDFADFELAGKGELAALFPEHAELIGRLSLKRK